MCVLVLLQFGYFSSAVAFLSFYFMSESVMWNAIFGWRQLFMYAGVSKVIRVEAQALYFVLMCLLVIANQPYDTGTKLLRTTSTKRLQYQNNTLLLVNMYIQYIIRL